MENTLKPDLINSNNFKIGALSAFIVFGYRGEIMYEAEFSCYFGACTITLKFLLIANRFFKKNRISSSVTMSNKWQSDPEIQRFRNYLQIPTVHPNINYGE